MRLITYQDPISGKLFEFITNIAEYKASTAALIHKNRWVIEVLFKQMKQNFELSYFLSDSPNGIKSQIWIALILNLLFSVLHRATKQAEDFSTMVQVVAKNLCCYMNITKFFTKTTQYCQDCFKPTSNKKSALTLFRHEYGHLLQCLMFCILFCSFTFGYIFILWPLVCLVLLVPTKPVKM